MDHFHELENQVVQMALLPSWSMGLIQFCHKPWGVFEDIDNIILKLVWKGHGPKITKTVMRKKSWRGIAITPLWKIVRQFLIKLNIYFPYNSAVALLGVYFHMKICMWLFIGTLFVIAPNWKQATCPSVGEIVVHTSPEMLCSNKKEQTIHITAWMDLKKITLSEKNANLKNLHTA